MSHQVGVSGAHQIDTDSNFMPVLGLWPLSKSSRVQRCNPNACRILWCGEVSTSCQGEDGSVYQTLIDQYLIM